MGHSVTPKYALDIYETRMIDGRFQSVKTSMAFTWDIKRYGRPTKENLEKFVLTYGKSLEIGGVNEGISKDLGYIPYPNRAVIRFNHAHGTPVATWVAPAFMVW